MTLWILALVTIIDPGRFVGIISREKWREGPVIGLGNIVVLFGIMVSWRIVLGAIRSLRATTLTTAWFWTVGASFVWTITWFFDQCVGIVSAAVADHAWYACTVLSLCPPIAVLGSRRPGTRVWTLFILLPMILVLGWPVGSLWLQGTEMRGLQLESPQLVAFCLVLVMGVGNYCGTRYTVSALIYGASILAVVVSNSVVVPAWLSDRSLTRFWSSLCVVLAIVLMKYSHQPTAATGIDQLWFDFFDTFGIVWGRRIQDRFNFIASKECLPVCLELDGFAWTTAPIRQPVSGPENVELIQRATNAEILRDSNDTKVELRVEHLIRWLLRRFVDPQWIDARLNPISQSQDS